MSPQIRDIPCKPFSTVYYVLVAAVSNSANNVRFNNIYRIKITVNVPGSPTQNYIQGSSNQPPDPAAKSLPVYYITSNT